MRLTQFLSEGKMDLATKLKALYHGLEAKRADRTKAALEKLDSCIEADQIFNVDFGEIKDTLSRSLEKVLEPVLGGITRTDDRTMSPHIIVYSADISSFVYLNTAKKQVRQLEMLIKNKSGEWDKADIDRLQTALDANKAAVEANELLTKLKPKIIKGRKPNPNANPNAFHSKLGSKEAQDLVKEKLAAGIKQPLDRYEESIRKYFQHVIENIAAVKEIKVERNKMDPLEHDILHRCFTFDIQRDDIRSSTYRNIKPNNKAATYAADTAGQQREFIETKYLAKNVRKLSQLIDLKGNLEKIEQLPYRAPEIASGSGIIESGFQFFFTDNSSFKVINKIVTKYSYSGTRFEQYPTTFHDVILPDKTKLKIPSEEKMVKEFGTWKAKP